LSLQLFAGGSFLSCQAGETFRKILQNGNLDRVEDASPGGFFASFRTAVTGLTLREKKESSYELTDPTQNGNSTRKKFD